VTAICQTQDFLDLLGDLITQMKWIQRRLDLLQGSDLRWIAKAGIEESLKRGFGIIVATNQPCPNPPFAF
jgi:hypothetical protein